MGSVTADRGGRSLTCNIGQFSTRPSSGPDLDEYAKADHSRHAGLMKFQYLFTKSVFNFRRWRPQKYLLSNS